MPHLLAALNAIDNESRDGDGEKAFYSTKMNVSDESKLQEFYLRWAIKDAYTKALGLGMNVEFQSCETRLMEVDGDAGGIDQGM